jgi:hypothetical protein
MPPQTVLGALMRHRKGLQKIGGADALRRAWSEPLAAAKLLRCQEPFLDRELIQVKPVSFAAADDVHVPKQAARAEIGWIMSGDFPLMAGFPGHRSPAVVARPARTTLTGDRVALTAGPAHPCTRARA